MSRALLFDALKALEGVKDAKWDADSVDGRRLITALRAALAEQPAAPAALTDDRIKDFAIKHLECDDGYYTVGRGSIMGWLEFARAILAAAIPPGHVVVKDEVEALRKDAAAVITQCRDALAEELAAYDIDPPIHHVKESHDACVAWLKQHGELK